MRKKMLRSVLVAAFSAIVAVGALSGFSGAKGEVAANTTWPSSAKTDVRANTTWPNIAVDGTVDGSASGSGSAAGGSGS